MKSNFRLCLVSFLCGMCIMTMEMTGSRIFAPYLGTSLVVWTALIGIIMASLAMGYWIGGKIADKKPEVTLLAKIICAASVYIALTALTASPLLSSLSLGIQNLYVSSILSALCLFAIPSVLLGMVSPFVTRLAIQTTLSAGATIGRFSALSSVGSIVGTFMGGYVLISFFSTRIILFFIAAVLGLTAALLVSIVHARIVPAILLVITSGILGGLSQSGMLPDRADGVIFETLYNSIQIAERIMPDSGRPVRVLQTDPFGTQSRMYIDNPAELVDDYPKYYDLAFYYKEDTRKMLLLGGGAYSYPKHLAATQPDVALDVVELDPRLTELAQEYFFLADRPNQRIFHEDARQFLNRSAQGKLNQYDAICMDIFNSAYNIPFHLTTAECMSRVNAILAEDGVFIANIIAAPDSAFLSGIYASIAASFPIVMMFSAQNWSDGSIRQNILLVALKDANRPTPLPENTSQSQLALLSHFWASPTFPKIAAFTDSFAPVERYAYRY